MIIAWHMITSQIKFTSKISFNEIVRTGVILPARMLKAPVYKSRYILDIFRPTKREWRKHIKKGPFGGLFYKKKYQHERFFDNYYISELDEIAGDNSYVFLSLSVFTSPRAFLPEILDKTYDLKKDDYGFGFDAEELIINGAKVRRRDYLEYYEQIMRRIATAELIDKMVNTMDESSEEFKCLLQEAMDTKNFDRDEILHYIGRLGKMKELRKALVDFKTRNDMHGSKALEFVRNAYKKCIDNVHKEEYPPECMPGSDFQRLEILWPGPLHIKNAKYVIEGGVTKRL